MLCSDVPGSPPRFAVEVPGGNHYAAREKALYSVRTGAPAFDRVYGVSRWEFNPDHREGARSFDEAMASVNSVITRDILAAYDFSSGGMIVDVGGGDGGILAQFSRRIRSCEE